MSLTSLPRVPFLDMRKPYVELAEQIDAAISYVVGRGRYVQGPEVEDFEQRVAEYVGVRHCVGVGSGLDTLHLALLAMGVGPGDEVLVPATTYIATWLAVTRTGATVVPVEPDPRTGNIDPGRLADAVTHRTRAIVPVHLHGCPADMHAIREVARHHHLRVLEDAAQAHGARHRGRRVGGLGDAAAWSFYPSKNLGALGDGGAVTTDDARLAERLRSLRNYGSTARYVHTERGFNSRLDEIQAAVLSAKLEHLDWWNARRGAIALSYLDIFADLPLGLPVRPAGDVHAWHVFAVRSERRDALAAHLDAAGVDTLIHYPVPPHLQGAYRELGLGPGDLPIAEAIARETLSLPIGPHMSVLDVSRVFMAVEDFHAGR